MSEPLRLAPKALQIEHEGARRGRWYVRVPAEHAIEDVLSPFYFGQCAEPPKPLRVPDVIEVEPEDLSWSLELTVVSVDAKLRRVVTRIRGEVQRFGAALSAAQEAEGFELRFIGREAGWGVFKAGDVIDQGFKTADAAKERLNQIAA